jgi:hypothetical protein
MFFRIRGVVMTPGWMGREISPKDSAIGSGGCWQSGTSPVAKMSESPTRQQAPTAISAFSLMTSQPSQASNFDKRAAPALPGRYLRSHSPHHLNLTLSESLHRESKQFTTGRTERQAASC